MEWTLIFSVILGSVISTRAMSVVNVVEGESAELYFTYPCDSAGVTLQHGSRVPFYRTGQSESSTSDSDLEKRFTIKNTLGSDLCTLHLEINPVERADAGTYSCQPYQIGSDVLSECPSIRLNIALSSGQVSCEWIEDHAYEVSGWKILSCTASSDSLSGYIQCYQNGETVPPKTPPVETNGTLHQTIWVRSNPNPVFCCSTTPDSPVDRCQCKNYVWDPSSGEKSIITTDPCTVSTPFPSAMPSQISAVNNTPPTTGAVTLDNSSNTECLGSYELVIGLVTVILILFVRLVFYYRAFHQQNRLRKTPVEVHAKLQDTRLVMESDEDSQIDVVTLESD